MIRFTDKYYVDIDGTKYIVYERKIAQTGKNAGTETFNNPSYHETLKEAMNNIYRRMTKDNLNADEAMILYKAMDENEQVKFDLNCVLDELTVKEKHN